MKKLTLEMFNEIKHHSVIAKGIAKNQPTGLFMTDKNKGDDLKWIAKKGGGNDWAIYCYWKEASDEFVLRRGQKVAAKEHIQRVLPCTDEVLALYRK